MSLPGHRKSVLLLHPFDALAGSQRVAVALARAFEGLQVPLEVHLGFGTNGFVSQLAGVHRFMDVNRIPLRKVLYPLWIIAMAPRMVWAACRGTLVWANTVHAIPAVLPMLWLAPNRVVLHIHEIEFPRLFQHLLSWATARGSHVLCVSNLHRRQLGVPADVLPNCVDNGDDTAPLEPPVLLFVGEVSAVKGFPLFVDVARRLSPARVRAVACVPHVPPPRRGWAEAARTANVEIRCGLSEPRQMFAGATLLLQCTDPSLWTETFSLVMAESLAFGVPVATAGTAVAPEIVGDAWAFDVPTRDPDLIAAEVLALLDDPQRLQALRAAARVRREFFSFHTFQSRVADVLDAVSGATAPCEAQPQFNRKTMIGVVGTVGVPGRYGGFETLAEQLARHIRPSRVRLVLYCQRSAYPEMRGQADTQFLGHQRVFVPLRANGPGSLLHDALAMLHAALMARVDVMLVLGYSGAWVLPLMRLLRPNLLIVTNIDGMEWRRDKFGPWAKRVLRWLEHCAVRFSHRVIADNAALVPLIQSIHPGLHPLLIAYGGDHTIVPPAASAASHVPPYYLSLARIEPENNCAMILKAFESEPSRRLVFVGNWNASKYGRALKLRYAQCPNLQLLDAVYDLAALAELRAGACGYVHGHRVGGTNPSLVEALFHTSSILAFDCSFNRSTLDGHGVYFADAEALGQLLRSEVNLEMAPWVIEELRHRFQWDAIAQAYLNACS